jgi:hypothetical protein
MKSFGIMVIGLVFLVGMTSFAMADPGINATFETAGLTITTTVQAQGNMDSKTDISWTQSSSQSLSTIPSLDSGSYYAASYQEDTQTNGVGYINYDKTLELDTSAALTNQYNIETTKQINFVGINGARIISDESMFVDGTGYASETANNVICVFGTSNSEYLPAFCNVIDTGSSIDMSVVNVATTTGARFVVKSADTPVEVYHTIRIDTLDDSPSIGRAAAYIKGSIMEGRGNSSGYFENVAFEERISIDGYITLFDKDMGWISGVRRV